MINVSMDEESKTYHKDVDSPKARSDNTTVSIAPILTSLYHQ